MKISNTVCSHKETLSQTNLTLTHVTNKALLKSENK